VKMDPFKVLLLKFVWRRSRALVIAGVALVAAGAAVAVGRSHVISEPLLGKEWQCSRTVPFVTTCALVREQNSRPSPEFEPKAMYSPDKTKPIEDAPNDRQNVKHNERSN
jgi:hypothetical protein